MLMPTPVLSVLMAEAHTCSNLRRSDWLADVHVLMLRYPAGRLPMLRRKITAQAHAPSTAEPIQHTSSRHRPETVR
jgi:hypothetical protein